MDDENNPIQSYGIYKIRNSKILKYLIIIGFIMFILNSTGIIDDIKLQDDNIETTETTEIEAVSYDELILKINFLEQVPGENEKIMVDCKILYGEDPKRGDIFHLESAKSSELVYEASVYQVEYYYDIKTLKNEGIRVYLMGVNREQIADLPEIRRVK